MTVTEQFPSLPFTVPTAIRIWGRSVSRNEPLRACYRCVRYCKDYAGGTDLGVYGAHTTRYFGRPEDGTLESSEFSVTGRDLLDRRLHR